MAGTANPGRFTNAERLTGCGQRDDIEPALDEGDVLDMGSCSGTSAERGGPCCAAAGQVISMTTVAIGDLVNGAVDMQSFVVKDIHDIGSGIAQVAVAGTARCIDRRYGSCVAQGCRMVGVT